jgi:glutamyl-tRNA synthetase
MSASKMPGVVTRFAPSPTGFLHIGGARTALFNWLFARHHGGKYLLRIEDTDRARSTSEAIDAIIDGLQWLGISGDGEPYFQSQFEARHHGGKYLLRIEDTDRARSTSEAIDAIIDGLQWLGISGDGEPYFQSQFEARHAEVAHQLIERGAAYRCYLTAEELTARREKAQADRKPFRIDSEWRERNDGPEGTPFAVRIRSPREGETVIEDLVQGRVAVANAELDDFVLLRSDGTPTYMLAVVVDDHDMGVSHVIRGDDHLNNAFRQLAIIRAMDWPEPIYAHIPLIHGPDGAKLSKRHGALGVDAYRDEMGMLPEALANYLLRLGWGHGDDEIISLEQAVQWFDLDHVGKSPSRFDFKKLENLNGHYLREADDGRLAELIAPRLGVDQAGRDLLVKAMPELKARAHDLNQLADSAGFLFDRRPLAIDDKAADLLTEESRRHLALAHRSLSGVSDWTHDATDAAVREVAESNGLKLGKLAQPLRAALTGRTTSPGIFDVLVLLGRDESLARIADQMLEPE